ncbi:sugar-transfer associated ATP-grasp domain-containing protein [Rhodohalobacter sp.]|uniref:sugar-transfer associated ATP-grasp domain-containing protein n=1 Tax=Rhodohalobacter sp. TaxID=1974210 RepID=UPI002ACDED21|nr:sugar-transfer associated ATP-grasp domain-containing protein [Rhodohalobacter sp.]MDZ7755210.1 sugar-transfer associated ATP-grasp domain-containing protein [Rhodohalobacter sp.]
MKIKRVMYLGYYIKQLDNKKFNLFLNYAAQKTGKSKTALLNDLLRSVFKYNISILEYFQFRFFEKEISERERWAGTGYMYEYQLTMNPTDERHILDDKRLFYKNYREFFVHSVADREELKNPETAEKLLSSKAGKLVFKASDGKGGAQVEIRDSSDFAGTDMIGFMKKNNYGLVEEFINQHPDLNRLSPSAVNTVRIFTQLNEEGEVEMLGCRLRISVNSPVDNMAAGNLAAPLDEKSGVVIGPAVYSDITKDACTIHPVTKVKIPGFQVPFWPETIEMVKRAAKKHPQNRSIGWDVVITEKGPGLIEGNHDWCKLLWQLPVQKGLKSILERYKGPDLPKKEKQGEPVSVQA